MHSALSRGRLRARYHRYRPIRLLSRTRPSRGNRITLPDAPQPSQKEIILGIPKDILHDQVGIWTSLARIRTRDLVWIAHLAVATGVRIATDRIGARRRIAESPFLARESFHNYGGRVVPPTCWQCSWRRYFESPFTNISHRRTWLWSGCTLTFGDGRIAIGGTQTGRYHHRYLFAGFLSILIVDIISG